MNKRTYQIVVSFFFLFLYGEITHAETIFDRAVKLVTSVTGDEDDNKQNNKKSDLSFKVNMPNDLPSHWHLSALREHVFGGEILLAEAGSINKPIILLVHGLGASGMRDWLNVVPSLEHDYRVVMLDLPGFASSSTPAGKYSPSNYARVLAEVKTYISPHEKIRVIGHSMGGAVTLRYAADFPDDVSSIVLVDAAGILERTAFIKHNASLPDILEYSPGKLNQIVNNTKDFGHNLVEVVNTFPDVTRLLVTDSAWAKVFGNRGNINAAFALIKEDFSDALHKVKIPVGILWGEDDGVAPLRTGKVLDRQLENASLVVIPGAKHVPMKSHPEQFNAYLKQLIETPNQTPSWSKQIAELKCRNEQGKTYSGSYKRIDISKCNDVTLINVTAEEIKIKNSRVNLENVTINSSTLAMKVKKSTVHATNIEIRAKDGIQAKASRFDIAGANIQVTNKAVFATEKSRFIFSISQIQSAFSRSSVHGVYQLENEILDKKI
ncbi:MAG: alpha/beta hydrolase [Agarilytica sp.]